MAPKTQSTVRLILTRFYFGTKQWNVFDSHVGDMTSVHQSSVSQLKNRIEQEVNMAAVQVLSFDLKQSLKPQEVTPCVRHEGFFVFIFTSYVLFVRQQWKLLPLY